MRWRQLSITSWVDGLLTAMLPQLEERQQGDNSSHMQTYLSCNFTTWSIIIKNFVYRVAVILHRGVYFWKIQTDSLRPVPFARYFPLTEMFQKAYQTSVSIFSRQLVDVYLLIYISTYSSIVQVSHRLQVHQKSKYLSCRSAVFCRTRLNETHPMDACKRRAGATSVYYTRDVILMYPSHFICKVNSSLFLSDTNEMKVKTSYVMWLWKMGFFDFLEGWLLLEYSSRQGLKYRNNTYRETEKPCTLWHLRSNSEWPVQPVGGSGSLSIEPTQTGWHGLTQPDTAGLWSRNRVHHHCDL